MMDRAAFIGRYAGIYEHSPWVAEKAAQRIDEWDDPAHIAAVMAEQVDAAPRERQLELIRAHPDLAGQAQRAGDLTTASTHEQASAGLDHCTDAEYERFQSLNTAYRDKFGFPFVMAVRGSSRADILAAFETRLQNDPQVEFEAALAEIHKIAWLRITALEGE